MAKKKTKPNGKGGKKSHRTKTVEETLQTFHAYHTPNGHRVSTELLDSGDVRVEGDQKGVEEFLLIVNWHAGYTAHPDATGVTLRPKPHNLPNLAHDHVHR